MIEVVPGAYGVVSKTHHFYTTPGDKLPPSPSSTISDEHLEEFFSYGSPAGPTSPLSTRLASSPYCNKMRTSPRGNIIGVYGTNGSGNHGGAYSMGSCSPSAAKLMEELNIQDSTTTPFSPTEYAHKSAPVSAEEERDEDDDGSRTRKPSIDVVLSTFQGQTQG